MSGEAVGGNLRKQARPSMASSEKRDYPLGWGRMFLQEKNNDLLSVELTSR